MVEQEIKLEAKQSVLLNTHDTKMPLLPQILKTATVHVLHIVYGAIIYYT